MLQGASLRKVIISIHSFPDCKEILVLAPHPDDEALGCAGAITHLNRKGVSSTVVFMTDGERLHGEPSQDIAEKRREEGRRVSQMLGCKEPVFLGFPDGEVSVHIEAVVCSLSDIIERQRPDIVLAPSLADYHQDHIAVSGIALRLFNTIGSFKLVFYEVYSTIRFNCLIDISEALEQKKKAILAYNTSLYGKPEVYVHASLGLNAYRSIFVQKSGYYEAFYMPGQADSEETILSHMCYRSFGEK